MDDDLSMSLFGLSFVVLAVEGINPWLLVLVPAFAVGLLLRTNSPDRHAVALDTPQNGDPTCTG